MQPQSSQPSTRLCYVVLSPTFGMYQVAADLANRFCSKHEVHLLASRSVPTDRFAPQVRIHSLTRAGNSGMEPATLDPIRLSQVLRTASRLKPDLVHFAAPHIWNLPLILWLRIHRVPIVYTLHDLDPHHGTRFSGLMRAFNKVIVRLADRVFVYGDVYRQRLVADGIGAGKITVIPLLHLFLSFNREQDLLRQLAQPGAVEYQPFALFFGRLEPYKGVSVLLDATRSLGSQAPRLAIAGQGDIAQYSQGQSLPDGVDVLNGHVSDEQAIELFRTCSLLVLPYIDATQSALVAAAYVFRKPVLVTRSGALAEYVQEGQTGFVIPPDDAAALAQAMQTAFAEPQRLVAMGEAGWQWYRQQRTQEYRTILDVYQAAVAGR